MIARLRGLLTLLVLITLSACASSRRDQGPAVGAVTIRVKNDIVPGAIMSVTAISRSGSRARLGTVMPGAEQTFTYKPVGPLVEYWLVAEPTGRSRARLVSQPILPTGEPDEVIRWELMTNNIIVNP